MSKLDQKTIREASHRRPRGFLFSAVAAGIKYKGRKDLALIYSRVPAATAGVFTTNQVKAAPVLLSMERLAESGGWARAVLVNSGNANACTGQRGFIAATITSSMVADALGIDLPLVLSCSTGVIGAHLPVQAVRRAVPRLVRGLDKKDFYDVARAIMTTDTFPKVISAWGRLSGKIFNVLGFAKGAGMIAPNMATMLGFVLTDAKVAPGLLDEVLEEGVMESFNLVTVDGDTSTNDTCLMLANGLAGNPELTLESPPGEVRPFKEAVGRVLGGLSKMIAQDGEGATKLVKVRVRGARTPAEAEAAAKTIANSPLVKTAIYGQDANWGRVMAALGRAGVEFDQSQVDVYIGKVKVVRRGVGRGRAAEKKAERLLGQGEVRITVDLSLGPAEVEVLTCDLSPEYISINADYRT